MPASNVIRVDFGLGLEVSESEAREVLALVHKAAVLLSPEYEVRVASRAGGRIASAFVQGTPFRLGVTVGLYAPRPRPPETEGLVLGVDMTADVEWLVDQGLATEGEFGSEYANPSAASVEEAVFWIRSHCRLAPAERVSARELGQWEKVLVGPQRVTLAQAVKVFGPAYGDRICVEMLVENHGYAAADARTVVTAVMKVLPRRRRS